MVVMIEGRRTGEGRSAPGERKRPWAAAAAAMAVVMALGCGDGGPAAAPSMPGTPDMPGDGAGSGGGGTPDVGGMGAAGAGGGGLGGAGAGDSGGAPGTPPGSPFAARPAAAFPPFDDTRLHDIALTMAADDWQSIIDDSRGDEWRHATLVYDGVTVDDVGVRPSGEGSRFAGNVKMSLRIKFDAFPGRGKFAGLKEMTVKGAFDDGSMMRERLALFVFRAMMPTPLAAHGRLVVNGGLRGLFTVRQVWDSSSLKEHFSEPLGPLYRLRPPVGMDPYTFIGNDPASYVPVMWDRHGGDAARGDEVIAPFLDVVSNQPAAAESVADMEALLSYLACAAVVQLSDGFVGDSGVEDHFQYFDPQSGKFVILPWDPDNGFGSAGEMPDRSIYRRFSSSKLALAVRDYGGYRARYKAKIAATMAKVPIEALRAEADRIFQQIKDAGREDPLKLSSNAVFDGGVGYLEDFAARRYLNLQEQLANGP